MKNKNMKKLGISLVETMLAMSLSTVIALIGTQLLISSMRAQTNALVQQTMLDQVSYAVGAMTFDMRMANKDVYSDCIGYLDSATPENSQKLFFLTAPNPNGGATTSAIMFLNQRNECVRYSFDSASSTIRIMKWTTSTELGRNIPKLDINVGCSPGDCIPKFIVSDVPAGQLPGIPIISDDFEIENAYFLIQNAMLVSEKDSQPRVTIMIELASKYKPDGKKPFRAKIQNTVAVPNLNK